MEGYPCKIIVNDIISYGKTREEHEKNLESVVKRLQKINLHLNKTNCEFRVQSMSFVGSVFKSQGLQVDAKQAIRYMLTPTNKTELQRFLEMTNNLSLYISHHSDKNLRC